MAVRNGRVVSGMAATDGLRHRHAFQVAYPTWRDRLSERAHRRSHVSFSKEPAEFLVNDRIEGRNSVGIEDRADACG